MSVLFDCHVLIAYAYELWIRISYLACLVASTDKALDKAWSFEVCASSSDSVTARSAVKLRYGLLSIALVEVGRRRSTWDVWWTTAFTRRKGLAEISFTREVHRFV